MLKNDFGIDSPDVIIKWYDENFNWGLILCLTIKWIINGYKLKENKHNQIFAKVLWKSSYLKGTYQSTKKSVGLLFRLPAWYLPWEVVGSRHGTVGERVCVKQSHSDGHKPLTVHQTLLLSDAIMIQSLKFVDPLGRSLSPQPVIYKGHRLFIWSLFKA